MFAKRGSYNNRKPRVVARDCTFCKTGTGVSYADVSVLTKYISERGKIIGKSRTGICGKHQRAVTNAIKRARIVGLMPFVVRA